MDLFEKLKKQREAREAAAKASALAMPTLASKAEVVKPEAPRPATSGFTLRRPAAAPTKPVIVQRTSQEVPEPSLDELMAGVELDDMGEGLASDDDEEFIDHDDVPAEDKDSFTGLAASKDHVLRRPVIAASKPVQPVQHVQEDPPKPKASLLTVKSNTPGAALVNSMLARGAGQLKAPTHHPSLDPGKVVAESVSDFDYETLMAGWPETEDDADNGRIAELNETRARLLQGASDHLQSVFANELEVNKWAAASSPAIADIAKISKLCFLRVKEAPSAWQMLDQVDRDTLIKGLLLSAEARSAAAKARKPKDAADMSNAFETMAKADPDLAEAFSNLKLEF